jgi:hypothetical protein
VSRATLLESNQDASLRVVGGLYERLAAANALPQHEASRVETSEFVRSAAELPLDQLVTDSHRRESCQGSYGSKTNLDLASCRKRRDHALLSVLTTT